MADIYTETTTKGLGSRLGDSIKGVVVGLVLAVVSVPLLYWNEGRAVRTAKSLREGAGAVVSVGADRIDAANEGKLVHFSGASVCNERLNDPTFNVAAVAVKLARKVEIYQWTESKKEETRKETGGSEKTTTTYTYDKKWSDQLEKSSEFKVKEGHVNPPLMPELSHEWKARRVTVGAFVLGPELIDKMGTFEKLPLGSEDLAGFPAENGVRAVLADGVAYYGANPALPAVGDLRISYSVVKPGPLSVIGKQQGKEVAAYQTQAGDALLMLSAGTHKAAAMFAAAEAENAMLTWILRLVGLLLMCIGIYSVFKPLAVVGDVVPIVGSMLAAGLGLFAALIGTSISVMVIAFAWVAYRPLVGGPLLLAGVAGIIAMVMMRKKKVVAAPVPGK
ncbi:MAG: TMEM43 family protein [Deltaproteobacteria bacterium]|nr:TMEM43 family protein [Deltaproteobacteria bacterium]